MLSLKSGMDFTLAHLNSDSIVQGLNSHIHLMAAVLGGVVQISKMKPLLPPPSSPPLSSTSCSRTQFFPRWLPWRKASGFLEDTSTTHMGVL